jgi:hypothetical protein
VAAGVRNVDLFIHKLRRIVCIGRAIHTIQLPRRRAVPKRDGRGKPI